MFRCDGSVYVVLSRGRGLNWLDDDDDDDDEGILLSSSGQNDQPAVLESVCPVSY